MTDLTSCVHGIIEKGKERMLDNFPGTCDVFFSYYGVL